MKLWLGREKKKGEEKEGEEEGGGGLRYEDLRFRRQVEGDLGRKMAVAARTMFEEEENEEKEEKEVHVVIVGSDIPSVSRKSFFDTFHILSLHSFPPSGKKGGGRKGEEREKERGNERSKGCVLGPVFDGGYYLVGMNDVSLIPVLFVDDGLLLCVHVLLLLHYYYFFYYDFICILNL